MSRQQITRKSLQQDKHILVLLQLTFVLFSNVSQMPDVYDIRNVIVFFFYEFIQFLSIPCEVLKSTVSCSEFYSFTFCEIWLFGFLTCYPAHMLETHWAAIHFSSSQSHVISKSSVTCISIEACSSSWTILLGLTILCMEAPCMSDLCGHLPPFIQIPYSLFEICEEADQWWTVLPSQQWASSKFSCNKWIDCGMAQKCQRSKKQHLEETVYK